MARRPKWLGGNHVFGTASPRFIKLLLAVNFGSVIVALFHYKVNGNTCFYKTYKNR